MNDDFGVFSDPDDSAVEDLISQIQDLSVLEQVAAINCSGFTDSVLPEDLESRFRRLKSFPVTKQNPKSSIDHSLSHSKSELGNPLNADGKIGSQRLSDEEAGIFSYSKQQRGKDVEKSSMENDVFLCSNANLDQEKPSKQKPKHGSASSTSDSSNSWTPTAIFSPSEQSPKVKKNSRSELKSGSVPSRLGSLDSPSSPRSTGCFWCSPKKASMKKSNENRVLGSGFDWDLNDDFLPDISVFSVKEQQKMLKKAMKEQEKISKEAAKIVKWAKQSSSSRMNSYGIEDELSDEERTK